ncbi:MAG: fibronectin type III domain-containing protein, partial [Spirochaetaceae bacterium]|nr:fibronectin type III domain-containing protein [Spirochaetaceae bacterium]
MTRGAFVAMRRLGARAAALAVLAMLGFAAPAAADVLVSNLDQPESSYIPFKGLKQALGFTTGSHGTGYTLDSIDLRVGHVLTVTVQLATGLRGGGKSHTVVATLTNPSTVPDRGNPGRFTAPIGTVLDANTKYWVVAIPPPLTELGDAISLDRTSESGETGEFGWSVDDNRLWMGRSGRWSGPAALSPDGVFMMGVNGTERASSEPILTVSGGSSVTEGTAASFTVTSDRAPSDPLTVNLTVSEPAGSDYVASSDEGSKTVTIPANATTATYSVTTQANSVVEPHGSVTVRVAPGTGYTVGTNSGASVVLHEAKPPPVPATGLTASHSSATAIGLAWALPTQAAGVTVSGLEVQQQSAGSWTTVASLGADATSHTVTDLTNGTSYTYRVRVAANHGSADSETVSMTALALPKPATGLSFSNVTATTVDLSWTLPEQGAGVEVRRLEVHGVRNRPDAIHRQEFRDDGWGSPTLAVDATSITLRAYHGGIIHDFRVRLYTNTGIVDSEVASWSSPLARPKPATDLLVSNVTATTVDLSWTLPEQGEGVVVSAVQVHWGEYDDPRYSYTGAWNTETLAGDATSYTVTGLKVGTKYAFRVGLMANSGNRNSEDESEWTLQGVSGVAVASDAGGDDTYALGEEIRIRVSFTSDVYVDTEGGIPRLKIKMDPASGENWAAYESGNRTSELTFVHTVVEPNISTQGIAVLADTLEANGGTIVRWGYWDSHADLSHDGLDHDPAHKVDWRQSPDTPDTPPTEAVPRVEVVSDPGADDTYAFGDTIRIRVRFGEAMDVTGAPRLKVTQSVEDLWQRWAVYEGGSGTDSLTFAYTVAEYDSTGRRGTAVLANTLELNGGTIRSAATGTDADLSHDGLDADPAHQVYWFHAAAAAEVTSHPASGESYGTGETIRIQVTFSAAVDVTGAPRLKIDMDAPPFGEVWAPYEGGSGTSSLTFAHTVAESDIAKKGLAVLSSSLELNGGTIRWTGTQADVPVAQLDDDAVLLHWGIGHHSAHKVNWWVDDPDDVDDVWVLGTHLDSRPASGDTYDIGETIRVWVTFDEPVLVTGTPRLKIKMDPAYGEKWAVYEGIPGPTPKYWYLNRDSRTFTYTVVEPNISTQGIAIVANSLEANGGTIKAEATGTAADLAHDGVDHDPAHKVNWRLGAPTVQGVGLPWYPASRDTYGLGETIRVSVAFDHDMLVAGTPRLKIKMDPAYGEKWATYEGGAGRDFLYFVYTVVEPNISTQGIAIVANSLEANGGLIWSAETGVIPDLSHEGRGHDSWHKVDWRPPPAVTDVGVTSDPGADGVYTRDETVEAAVTFSTPVTVDTSGGTPTLALIANGSIRRADYASGSGTARLVFSYPVTEADGSLRAEGVAASGLMLGGGTIVGVSGTTAELGFGATPGVTSVSITDSPTGLWNGGGDAAVEAVLRFSEPVTVEGTLTVRLDMEGTVVFADYVRGSGTDELTFAYAIAEDEGPWRRAGLIADSLSWNGLPSFVSAGGGLAVAYAHPPATRTLELPPAAGVWVDAPGTEGGSLDFAVRLNRASDRTVTVDWATDDGTAVASEDYTAGSGTVTFTPRETAKTVAVALLADDVVEGDETLTLRITGTDGALLANAGATGTVTDATPPPPGALTATFVGMPAEHNGKKLFGFEIRFSEEFRGLRLTALKAGALQVAGGRLVDAKRTVRGQNRSVTVRVRPASFEDVTITLAATTDCTAATAICTADGRKLAKTATGTVLGPALLSVADARATEGVDPAGEFAVTLSRAASDTVTVDYATADGTATAGADYTAMSGTLTFAAGETAKTVAVPVLDDAHDEGEETFRFRLSNAQGAVIADREAVGTIVNEDRMPRAWLARFGRTAWEHTLDAVQHRLDGAGNAATRAAVAGREMRAATADPGADDARQLASLAAWIDGSEERQRTVSVPELLAGSAFQVAASADEAGGGLNVWGQGAYGRFEGRDGDLSVDGEGARAALGGGLAGGAPGPQAGGGGGGLLAGGGFQGGGGGGGAGG